MTNEQEKKLQSIIRYFQSRNRQVDSETEDKAIEYLYNLIGEIEQQARSERTES